MRPLATLALVLLSGCVARETYLLRPSVVHSVDGWTQEERARAAVPAVRERDGRNVYLRAGALQLYLATPDGEPIKALPLYKATPDGEHVRMPTEARNWRLGTGIGLTIIGPVLAVAGVVLGVMTAGGDAGSVGSLVGGIVLDAAGLAALGAGIGLIVTGRRPPLEAPEGDMSIRYLESGPPSVPPPPARVLGFFLPLRF
jgi:hypothetical protein